MWCMGTKEAHVLNLFTNSREITFCLSNLISILWSSILTLALCFFDIILYLFKQQNSVELNLNGQLDQYKTRIIIRYDGQHTWYIPAIITAGCSIDILYFPFDYQKCPMQFGSWSYSSPELDLEVTRSDVDISFYQESSHFWLIKTAAVRNSIKYRYNPYSKLGTRILFLYLFCFLY